MSNMIMSDGVARRGGAAMFLKNSLDGLGAARGFVVSFSWDLELGVPRNICGVTLWNENMEAAED